MGLFAAADEAKESMTSLESELESVKAQMADLKKVAPPALLATHVRTNANKIILCSSSGNHSIA